ncbi:FecR domain-containing protein [Hyphomonas sp. CY54-11-8]|uniref:FecR domain-containing protein n=1 Tax=Hyphomonas sp. CY54-11-8 TaxID=1280944 RepID=UPI000458E3B1|nr:FecR domain-containing protein [Hyphomonas sp. CY54-11-8]KCZ47937.1 hypothetical protein HY17_05510 [Hyphomonas sp. CY54-11-8]
MTDKRGEAARRETAALWFAELQAADVSQAIWERFLEWERDPANAAAYREIETTLGILDQTSLSQAETGSETRPGRGRKSALLALAAAAAVILLSATALMTLRKPGAGPSPLTYATAIGEQQAVTLEDGSVITLNTNTRLTVLYSKTERLIRLTQGEALFEVEHADRPFLVEAAGTRTRALGTEFDIHAKESSVSVTLIRGSVRVTGSRPEEGKSPPGEMPGESLQDAVAALASQVWGTNSGGIADERAKAAGLDLADRRLQQTLALTKEIIGFPRHLSQHVGGFVITRGRLDELCPVENAAMADRTIIEWDKDDIDVIGMLKVDVLALGMLSCIRKAFDLLRTWKGMSYSLATLPPEDPAVYDMLCVADTIGVFQVESRAQMSFLPRMRPRCFYDLVIEVAIIRPGPIQGDMVHPYIKRRRKEEAIVYPSEALEPVLGKTLGVPLFQEQAMQIAIVAAGFTATEADQLRRALGSFRGPGSVETFRERFIAGCLRNGYDLTFAETCFRQLEGFSGYGFPESHAASFALLVYASSWIKCHHPEVFCCALLNAQPMGFYAPAQIIRDARAHGVKVLPVCAERSYWDNVLEPAGDGSLAVRLGFRQIKGISEEDGHWLAAARGNGYRSIDAVWRRAGVGRGVLSRLAGADGFAEYGLSRRDAVWEVKGLGGDKPLPLFEREGEGLPAIASDLPAMSEREEVFEDYVATRLTLRDHPVRLLRPEIGRFTEAAAIRNAPDRQWITVTGLVITRQRPGTASGVIFLTLEDDTGVSNVIVWPGTFEKYRKQVMAGRLVRVTGRLQREGIVTHVVSSRIEDLSCLLDTLGDASSAGTLIDPTHDNADDVKRPTPSGEYGPRRPERKPLSEEITAELQRAQQLRYGTGGRHPREQAKKLFYSRDFH